MFEKMVKNCQKWSKMVEMVKNGQKMVKSGQKLSQMFKYGHNGQ